MIFYKVILINIFFIQILLPSDLDDAIYFFVEGEISTIKQEIDPAISYYNSALALVPSSYTINYTLAESYYQNKDYYQAINAYHNAYELNPNLEVGSKIISLYNELNQVSDAIEFLDVLLVEYPNNIQLLHEKARMFFLNQNWQSLISIYSNIYELERDRIILDRMIEIAHSIDLLPIVYDQISTIKSDGQDEILLLEVMAQIAYSLENYQIAIKHLNNLKLISDSNMPYLLLTDIYMRNNNYNEAKLNLEYVYNNQKSFEIMKALLICYSNLDELNNVVKLSKSIIEKYPEETFGFESHVLALTQNFQYSEAIEILLIAKKKFPESFLFSYYLGNIYKQIKQYEDALVEYNLSILLQPESKIVWHSMALTYEELEKYDKSDSLFTLILNSDNYNSIDMNDYAYIISERKFSQEEDFYYALSLAKRAIQLDPSNFMIMDTLGWIYYKIGDYKMAVQYLEASVEIDDNNPVILEHLGDVYYQKGDYKRAKDLFIKALSINPSNDNLKMKLEPIKDD